MSISAIIAQWWRPERNGLYLGLGKTGKALFITLIKIIRLLSFSNKIPFSFYLDHSGRSSDIRFFGKRPLAIATMSAELPPFKNGEHNSENASTLGRDNPFNRLPKPEVCWNCMKSLLQRVLSMTRREFTDVLWCYRDRPPGQGLDFIDHWFTMKPLGHSVLQSIIFSKIFDWLLWTTGSGMDMS